MVEAASGLIASVDARRVPMQFGEPGHQSAAEMNSRTNFAHHGRVLAGARLAAMFC